MAIYVKYLPQVENLPDTERKGNIYVANNIGGTDYGPTSVTGFYGSQNPPEGGYLLFLYNEPPQSEKDQIPSKPVDGGGLELPPERDYAGTWSKDYIPTIREFINDADLVSFYNNFFGKSLDITGVISDIESNDNLYLSVGSVKGGGDPPPVGGGTPGDSNPG
jgi:hypothetical protein